MEENNAHVFRTKLESLSTDELIKKADSYGIDIPAGLERIFIIEEIMEAAGAGKQTVGDDIQENPSYSEASLLPKQYNISFVEVIIRDPLWVFVFWEVKGHDKEMHENADDFKGYCLRIIPLDEKGNEFETKEDYYSVSVSAEDNHRYLGLAEHHEQDFTCYAIKLNVIRGEDEISIASSIPFYLPRLIEKNSLKTLTENPLIHLSGSDDLLIVKNTDRQPRIKRPV